ncbi:MAG: CHAD domain-containing protein [Candidatus Binatia bacterium]
MAYRLETEERIDDAVRRIAGEQIEQAVARLPAKRTPSVEAVHEIRKRLKKTRAVLRLVRDALGPAYQAENAALRDIAAKLAPLRDAAVVVESFDGLRQRFRAEMRSRAFARLRDALLERQRAAARSVDAGRVGEVRQDLQVLLTRIATWHIDGDPGGAVISGSTRAYQRARKGFRRAYRDGSPECFHEFRKAAKDCWYHTCLLEPMWRPVLKGYRTALHDIGDLVGEEHDLSVLADVLRGLEGVDANAVHTAGGLIDRRRHDLRAEVAPVAARVHADRRKAWQQRLRACWDAWRAESNRQSLFADGPAELEVVKV